MADDITKYYKNYYADHGANSYTMGTSGKGSSRVYTLVDWIRQHTLPGARIVDVGCGDMELSRLVPDREWLGLDINTEKAQGRAVVTDLASPPYPVPTGSQDAVVCSEVLEHVWDLRVVNKEVKRMLRKGGQYFMSTPNFDWIDHYMANFQHLLFDPGQRHLFEHIRFYNLAVHARFLEEAGFDIQEYTGSDAHYTKSFSTARAELKNEIVDKLGHKNYDDGRIDQIIGKMFPLTSHTIMVRSES